MKTSRQTTTMVRWYSRFFINQGIPLVCFIKTNSNYPAILITLGYMKSVVFSIYAALFSFWRNHYIWWLALLHKSCDLINISAILKAFRNFKIPIPSHITVHKILKYQRFYTRTIASHPNSLLSIRKAIPRGTYCFLENNLVWHILLYHYKKYT